MQDNKNKKPIVDLVYSFTAYALPTFVLQFVILPFAARQLPAEENGLFLTLFNIVRLFVSLLIVPLYNIRLLKKKECEAKPELEKTFNFMLIVISAIASGVILILGMFYYDWNFSIFALLRLVAVFLLLSMHDYFAIAFRVNITYKYILVDNLMIVLGYAVGIVLMMAFGFWEVIFICGYSFGLAYTLIKTNFWKKGVKAKVEKRLIAEYGQLGFSTGVNSVTVYCDKMLIYPLIGGYSVSVYNAASVVSKLITLISTPLRNVFLSYIVDVDNVTVSSKKRKIVKILFFAGTIVLYAGFYVASVIICKILYPQYYDAALQYIPIILLAILLETYSSLLKVYLLRFEKTILQVYTSFVKLVFYLASVIVLNVICNYGLLGFCFSILIADGINFIIMLILFLRTFKRQNQIKNIKQ